MLNVKWAAAVIVYVLTQVVKNYGIQLPDGWEAEAFNYSMYAVQFLAFLFAALWDKHKKHAPIPTMSELVDETAAAVQNTPNNYNDLVPYIETVHDKINELYKEVQCGKYTESTKQAADLYVEMASLIKSKGVTADASTKSEQQ